MDRSSGSRLLEQRVLRFAGGRSQRARRGRSRRAALRRLRVRHARGGRRRLRARARHGGVHPLRRALARRGGRERVADGGGFRAVESGRDPGAAGDRPLRGAAGASRRRQAQLPLPREPGCGLRRRDAVPRRRPAVPRARPQPFLRRGGLHRRGAWPGPRGRRVGPARGRILLPLAAGGGSLHREHRPRGDADPRRVPPVRGSGVACLRRGRQPLRSRRLTDQSIGPHQFKAAGLQQEGKDARNYKEDRRRFHGAQHRGARGRRLGDGAARRRERRRCSERRLRRSEDRVHGPDHGRRSVHRQGALGFAKYAIRSSARATSRWSKATPSSIPPRPRRSERGSSRTPTSSRWSAPQAARRCLRSHRSSRSRPGCRSSRARPRPRR